MRRRHHGQHPRWLLAMLAVAAVVVVAAAVYVLRRGGPVPDAGAAPGFTQPAPAKPLPVLAFLGDSYTEGAGASSPDKTWDRLACVRLNMRCVIDGLGHTGYVYADPDRQPYPPRAATLARDHPDVLVIEGGHNDLHEPPAKMRAAVLATLHAVRTASPTTKIVVLGVLWEAPVHYVAATTAIIRSAAATVPGVKFVDPVAQGWLWPPGYAGATGDKTYIGADGVHPNDVGQLLLLRHFLASLRQLGVVPVSGSS